MGGTESGSGATSSNDFGPACDLGPVTVTVFAPEVADAVFEQATNRAAVTGVGDEAFYDSEFHRIRVRKHDVRVQIACLLCSGDEKAQLTDLARRAAARIA